MRRSVLTGCPCARDNHSGFGLVELIIALALACGLLADAWGWAWSICGASSRVDDALELRSALAYAERSLSADVHQATRLLADDGPGCTDHSLTLRVPGTDGSRVVPIVFDPARGLLWRLTSSCHLIDGLVAFRFRYLDGDGDTVGDGDLTADDAGAVRRVVADLQLRRGRVSTSSSWTAVVGGGEL